MAEALAQAPEPMRKTKRELREDEFVSLYPNFSGSPGEFSDIELDGLIAMGIRRAESQDGKRRHRRLR